MTQLNTPEFISFLQRAKAATYAGGGAETAPWRPGSHDLRHEEGGYLYIDTYLGGYDFIGEEAVWHAGVPLWGMNYYGWMLVPAAPEGFFQFLKDALGQAPAEAPYRGPARWQRGDFAYICRWEGELARFSGEESILHQGQTIYRLVFHGGRVRG